MKTKLVVSLGLAVLIAACSSGGGGGEKLVVDAGDGAAADHPAGDAPGDRGNDRGAEAGVDVAPTDAAAPDALAIDGGARTDASASDVPTFDAAIDAGPATPVAAQVPIA